MTEQRYTMRLQIVAVNEDGSIQEEPNLSWTCVFATTNLEDCNADMDYFSERIDEAFADAWQDDKEAKRFSYCDPIEEELYRAEQAEESEAEDIGRTIFLSTYNTEDLLF